MQNVKLNIHLLKERVLFIIAIACDAATIPRTGIFNPNLIEIEDCDWTSTWITPLQYVYNVIDPDENTNDDSVHLGPKIHSTKRLSYISIRDAVCRKVDLEK